MKTFGNVKIVSATVVVLFLLSASVCAELPSCYRARCSHCTVDFIAKMCPSTCGACGNSGDGTYGPKLRPGRLHSSVGAIGNARAHGVPAVNSQMTAHREVHLPAAAAEAGTSHGNAPTAQQLPDTPYGNPYALQQQPQQFYTAHQQNPQQYLNQQFLRSQQPQQQFGQQLEQTTSYGSSYGAPSFPNAVTAGNQQQPFNTFVPQQPSYYGTAQQQQPGLYGASQSSQAGFYDASAVQPSQPFGFFGQAASGQPAPSPFINPFQPFLQQSLQAQQQAPYFQPFTPSPFTSSPMLGGLGTPLPALGNAPSSGNTGPIASLPPPAPVLPSYFPAPQPAPAILSQQSSQIPYAAQQGSSQYTYVPQAQTGGQSAQLPTENQRPKQIYAQPSAPSQSYRVPQKSVLQQVVPSAAANSIDGMPNYVNKNSYGDKSGGQLQSCPKQPNWEPCVSKEVANERFHNCCLRLGDGCSQLCSYDQTLATIQIAVLTGRCPLGKVADMMICASGYEDATACCQAYNVFEPGFEHCRPYCNPAAGLPNDGMLAEKYRCLGKLSQIQRCFYVSQKP